MRYSKVTFEKSEWSRGKSRGQAHCLGKYSKRYSTYKPDWSCLLEQSNANEQKANCVHAESTLVGIHTDCERIVKITANKSNELVVKAEGCERTKLQ